MLIYLSLSSLFPDFHLHLLGSFSVQRYPYVRQNVESREIHAQLVLPEPLTIQLAFRMRQMKKTISMIHKIIDTICLYRGWRISCRAITDPGLYTVEDGLELAGEAPPALNELMLTHHMTIAHGTRLLSEDFQETMAMMQGREHGHTVLARSVKCFELMGRKTGW